MLNDKKFFCTSLPVLEIILLQFISSKTSSLFFRTLKAVRTHFKNHASNSLLFPLSLIDFKASLRFPKLLFAADKELFFSFPFLIKKDSTSSFVKRLSFDV